MPRISLKIVGASGQGINSIGGIIAKGLKRSGYCAFGYREYPQRIQRRSAAGGDPWRQSCAPIGLGAGIQGQIAVPA
jgi:hypothetical protein